MNKQPTHTPSGKNAFTLLEVSVVLVVIGLIVGGVLGGQAMLHNSQVMGLGNELSTYVTAVQQFRTEFNTNPGDLNNATSYWGIAAGSTGNDATCYSADETHGTGTCNGDNDGTIEIKNPISAVNDCTEISLALKHMNNAGLIPGTYSGTSTTAGDCGFTAGVNSPKLKLDLATLDIEGPKGCYTSSGWYYTGCYGVVIHFGSNWVGNEYLGYALTPGEMYNLDKKLDDGMPGLGQFRAVGGGDTGCDTDSTTYVLSNTNVACRGLFGVDPIKAY